MDKTVVSLLCETLKRYDIDVDKIHATHPEQAVNLIHMTYDIAANQLNSQSQS